MTGFGSQLKHDQYEELCALATAGILSHEESELLTAHLERCAQCREAFSQYQIVATEGMSFLAEESADRPNADGFDELFALDRLMRATEGGEPKRAPQTATTRKERVWNLGWVRGLAAACIVAGVGISAYWTGARSADVRVRGISAESRSALDRTTAEKQRLERSVQADHQQIAALEQQTIADEKDVERLRAHAEFDTQRLAQVASLMDAAKQASDTQLAALRKERNTNAEKLRDAEQMYETVQYELNKLRTQHQQDAVHLASLEASVNSLTSEANDQSRRARTDERYLARDKDIRDLIGARNLYIADIMDVNNSGKSRKPFGRVFYTKTRSLIFYAYDLDRQPGVRRTSTFQVWGRTGADGRKPINLGILYMDSATNRRWTLRVDNPEQLARLDSIFVTIEPHEQSDKPTGKPFLYASLQRVPNHP